MAAAIGNARPRARGRGRGNGGAGLLQPGGNRGVDPGFSPFSGKPRIPGANGNGGTNAPTIGNNRPAGGRGRGRGGNGAPGSPRPKGGLGEQALPGPGGAQLERRVQSGKITQEQAQRTMKQRQTLKAAFGDDWRSHLQVGGQSFAQVRKGLGKNPGNAKLAALNKKLLTNRKAALEAARKKLAGGEEGEGAGGRKKTEGQE